MEKWNRCDICGKFISYEEFSTGKATSQMVLPDSPFTRETHETVHTACLGKQWADESIDKILDKKMTIYEKIAEERKDFACGNRATLSLLLSEICIDGKPMSDKDAIARLTQMKKVADKNIVLYHNAGKHGPALDEASFAAIIEEFLPSSATAKEITTEIEKLGLPYEMKSMGPLMKHLKSKFEVVDGTIVKKVLMRE